jgi:cytochrome c oxidase assembly protein subunit 15
VCGYVPEADLGCGLNTIILTVKQPCLRYKLLKNPNHKAIAIWLLICCATIYAMIILGGVTRLTGSGLSMVQWEPLMGILPPLNHAQWQETFLIYQ